MTTKEVATMIESVGIPYAYYQFPNNTEQTTPFICFFYSGDNDFKADDSNYQKIEHLIVELYTDNKDFTLEAEVEGILSSHGMVWTRFEEWIESERMLQVIYEMDVVITAPEPEPEPEPVTTDTEEDLDGEQD